MKKFSLLLLLFIISPVSALSYEPVDSGSFEISALSCPEGMDYGICGGNNYALHNEFIGYMKSYDVQNAIKAWDQMNRAIDGISEANPSGSIPSALFGTFSPGGDPLPLRIYAKKGYKGGIVTLGSNCVQDCGFNLYYLSFIKYKRVNGIDMLYVYNESLAPIGSKQYKTYTNSYANFSQFDQDATSAFYRGKFNNKNTNAVYQKFIKSIR